MFRTLIDAPTLAAQLGTPGWVVVDCRFALGEPALGARLYLQSRIPGAFYAHLENQLSAPRTPTTGRHPLPDPKAFAVTLAAWAITGDTQVVAYDDSFGSIAARLWWLLRWVGHDRVALLDGGWPAWKRARLPIDTGTPSVLRAALPPYPIQPNPDAVVDAAFVDRIRGTADWCLLDARPEERYSGEREPIDPIAGHIPGSRNFTYEDNLEFDGCLLGAAELRAAFVARLAGIAPEHVVHTCGSGVTACHNLLAMEHAGLSGGKLYAGSWSDWITDPSRPIARGND